jgi:serine/threonine protein kinase
LAIKVLSGGMARSPAAIARFEREIEAVGKLDHPGIVQAFDGGQRQGVWFLTMEWVDGCKISDVECLVASGLDPREVGEVLTGVFADMMFRGGFVHGDPHPGNLLVRSRDRSVALLPRQSCRVSSTNPIGLVKGNARRCRL